MSKTAVGANQLADVRWSAVFDDVELTAADIARLAKEARPLIRTPGRWVALDQVDLKAAAEALAEREKKQLSGGEMLRLANKYARLAAWTERRAPAADRLGGAPLMA